MSNPGGAVSSAYARIANRRTSAANYEAAPAVPEDLLEPIRHLRARVADVLQRAEGATKALAA